MQVNLLSRYIIIGKVQLLVFILNFVCSEIALSLQDMIHVVDTKPVRRYGDYFLRQIVKVYSFSCLPVLQFYTNADLRLS